MILVFKENDLTKRSNDKLLQLGFRHQPRLGYWIRDFRKQEDIKAVIDHDLRRFEVECNTYKDYETFKKMLEE